MMKLKMEKLVDQPAINVTHAHLVYIIPLYPTFTSTIRGIQGYEVPRIGKR